MQNPKIFQKISKPKIFEIFENIKFFKKNQNFQISQSQSPSQSSKSVTWFFYRNEENIWSRKFWGPAEISGIARLLDVMLNIQASQKSRLFSKKSRFCFFFHPEGPGTRNLWGSYIVIFGKTCSLWRESHFFQKAHFLPWETTQNITTDSSNNR